MKKSYGLFFGATLLLIFSLAYILTFPERQAEDAANKQEAEWFQSQQVQKAAKGDDPMASANQVQSLEFLPFSGWFPHIQPQINAYAKCSAAALGASKDYQSKMLKVVIALKQNLIKVLPAVDNGAKYYQLETEYNRLYYQNRGYMQGVAKATQVPLEMVMDAQAQDCIDQYYEPKSGQFND